MHDVRVGSHRRRVQKVPSVLYRGSTTKRMSPRGLESGHPIGDPVAFLPATPDKSVAHIYASDQALDEGGTPIIVEFSTRGLHVTPTVDPSFEWDVSGDHIPKKNILSVEKTYLLEGTGY